MYLQLRLRTQKGHAVKPFWTENLGQHVHFRGVSGLKGYFMENSTYCRCSGLKFQQMDVIG